ncbi:MAG TPA: glycosyltransferase family 4 protein [Armatimonadota bacterium]|jgi:glycosyltransferase involved in cell wall biosynthesis
MKNYAAAENVGDETRNKAAAPRVCLLSETFYPVVGGGETHARLLADRLNSKGTPVFALTRRSSREFPSMEKIDNTTVFRVPPSGMKRFGKYFMTAFVLRELFRRRRDYDLIFVCGYRVLGAAAVLAARRLNKACVLRAEALGEMSGGYASAYKRLPPVIGPIFRSWIRMRNRLLVQADGFVSISQPIKDEFIEQGADPNRVFTAPNGIDTRLFSPVSSSEKSALRKILSLPADAVIVSYSGKLNQGKGLEYLLDAWKSLAASRQNLHLLLIGSGGGQALSCEEKLRAYVSEHGLSKLVTFTGYVENVQEYLQSSDLFVFPSENEALGISLIEAMSCGLPAVASRTGGIPEVVQHMDNGILIEPGSSDAIVEAVSHLLDEHDLARELAQRARETACTRFSMETVAEQYADFFSSIMRKREANRIDS